MLARLIPLCLLLSGSAAAQETPLLTAGDPFLTAGDTVALLGNTFVEREQRDGFMELELTLALPEADVTFRNLGWSGDTVDGRARRFFGPTRDGFKHLLDHVDVVKPTVILVSYGTNAAFEGSAGREAFLTGYGKLLDELQKRTKRIALLSAPPLDPAASPAPEVAKAVNGELRWQAQRLAQLAKERGLHFVDLFTPLARWMSGDDPARKLTDNGMHLTPVGYRLAAQVVVQQLLLPEPERAGDLSGSLTALSPQREGLRQKIIEKNRIFFHRHRPQNETYLRGFRKHEQGNNATEILDFEPLVLEKDRVIFALRAAAAGS